MAVVTAHFFETLAASALAGRRGDTDPGSDICPDLHIKRGSQPTLVEVKGGSKRRAFKCDTRQLERYKECGERVEYAFIARNYKKTENVSNVVDTIQELFEFYASRISYMVVLDISIVYSAWKEGLLHRKTYDSWNSNHNNSFDCVHMNQKFLRDILAGGACRVPATNFVWRKRQRRASTIEVSGVKFKVNSFPIAELVQPDFEIPF